MNNLRISVIPLDIAWADIDENLYATGRALAALPADTDVAVLPELFSTGFISSPELLHRYSEDASDSHTIRQLQLWAARYNMAIVGSLLVRQGENFFNRGFFVEPSGDVTYYDKKHLFSLSSEHTELTPGAQRLPIVRFRGFNIALAICYDLRFPVWLRNCGQAYDLLIIPANWPAKRSYAWQHLLIARAIENQAYVVGVNRTGRDDSGEYGETSLILNYLGKPIAESTGDEHNHLTAVLDRERLVRHRENYPFSNDADEFKILNS